jgi:hypothetical protein
MPARAVSTGAIIVMMIIPMEPVVIPAVSVVSINVDHSRSRIAALYVAYWRRRAIYRLVVNRSFVKDRTFVVNRESDPDIQTHLSPSITATAQ